MTIKCELTAGCLPGEPVLVPAPEGLPGHRRGVGRQGLTGDAHDVFPIAKTTKKIQILLPPGRVRSRTP